MTRQRRDWQIGRSTADEAARWRITRKYRPDWTIKWPIDDAGAFAAVDKAVQVEQAIAQFPEERKRHSFDPPEPTVEDVLDALRFAESSRTMIDYNEMLMIGFARAHGATWQQLAESLCYADRQSAERRYQTLRRRWPGYEPPAPVVGPSDGTSDGEEGAQP